MALRFHCVVAFSDEIKFEKVLYAGDDGEAAVKAYHAARDSALFPTIAYFRNPMHSKRCRTLRAAASVQVPAPASQDGEEGEDGEEEDGGEDLAELVAKAGKGKGKK